MKKKEMSLLEKWKNRETKKKLREENIRLKNEIEMIHKIPKPPICTVERNVQRVCANWTVTEIQRDIPSEIVKNELLHKLSESLSDFVEYDFTNDRYGNRMFTAILYVATGDNRHEH